MGSPRQERFALHLRDEVQLGTPVIWCVGALFEYLAGERFRAPRWVRRIGMEWLVRLALEPRRMWRRYLIGNLVFVWRVATGRRLSGFGRHPGASR
jgi:N-acetylglucosaminyldiphosphoundecaprenol N-acetyl-beta-D-mannosaminyltransferase